MAINFQFVLVGLGFTQNTTNVTQTGDDNDAAIDQVGVILHSPA